MDFGDPSARRIVSRALGEELRRAREKHGWSRAEFVAGLSSGIGDRTLLSYEHGTRELAVLRWLELCAGLRVEPTDLLGFAVQRAGVLLDTVALRVDLRALLADQRTTFRPMHPWARNKLNRHPDGTTRLAPDLIRELADFIGCAHEDLAAHLARFTPDADHE